MNDELRETNGVMWRPSGLRIELVKSYMRNSGNGGPFRVLSVSALNPEREITQALTRSECVRLGLYLIWKAFFTGAAE